MEDAENKHIGIAVSLYQSYLDSASSVLGSLPILSELKFGGYDNVVMLPCHQIEEDDMVMPRKRDEFFLSGIEGLVIAGLSSALLTM